MNATYEKPITDNQREIGNKIYSFLRSAHRNVTKEEICAYLGWEYTSSTDRKVRDTINLIKKRRPIVATPDQKGYFLCLTRDDIERCEHQCKYVDSIIEDLEQTKRPLISFLCQFEQNDDSDS